MSIYRLIYTKFSIRVMTLLSLFSFSTASVLEKKPQSLVIDTFTSYGNSKIPAGWRPSRNDTSMFSVRNEKQNFFTRIFTKGGCTSIGKLFRFSAREYPILTWKWRVNSLPEGAKEDKKDANDSGASVYIIFKGNFKLNNILKYVWSSTLPEGTVTGSPYNKNAKIIVLRSGGTDTGKWVTEKVNIRQDYKRLFGKEPPPVEGIAILSDADNTRSVAAADYDDLMVRMDTEE